MAYTFGASADAARDRADVFARLGNAGASSASATYSLIADTTGPTGGALTRQRHDGHREPARPSYNTTGSFTIGTRTDFSADAGSGLLSLDADAGHRDALERRLRHLRHADDDDRHPTQTSLAAGCYRYTLTGTDRVGNAPTLTTTSRSTRPRRSATSPRRRTPPSAGGGDVRGHRHRLGGRHRRRPAAPRDCDLTLSSNTCGAFTPSPTSARRGSPRRSPTTSVTQRTNATSTSTRCPTRPATPPRSVVSATRAQHNQAGADGHRRHDPGQQRRQAAGQRRDHPHLQRADRGDKRSQRA